MSSTSETQSVILVSNSLSGGSRDTGVWSRGLFTPIGPYRKFISQSVVPSPSTTTRPKYVQLTVSEPSEIGLSLFVSHSRNKSNHTAQGGLHVTQGARKRRGWY